MKVALVHDYIKEYGGAERVLEAVHEIWPEAPVFTTVYLPEFLGPHKERFKNWEIRPSWAQYLPFKAKLISPLRLLAPFLFKKFNFSKFDVVIVSATGAYIPNAIKVKNQKSKVKTTNKNSKLENSNYTLDAKRYPLHICYCHTPPRYLYGYMTAREWKRIGIVRVVGEIMNHFLRLVDFKSAQNVDYFIANSQEVRSRIKKFYRREAKVVYPPVDTAFSKIASSVQLNKKLNVNHLNAKRYYLAGGRLARAKGIDVIIEAFAKLKKPLKIFGKGFAGYEKELRIKNQELSKRKNPDSSFIIHNSNIEFLGEVSDEEKMELMRNAKAYVFASYDEDFGITPVEAMSVGTPVIAYRSGGVQESVIEGKTGLFFEEPNADSLVAAIEQLNNLTINPADCIKQAQKFSKERFKKEIKKFVISTTYKKRKKD